MATLQLSNGRDNPPIVYSLYEHSTSTWQYIIADPATKRCIVIDPARDYCNDETAMSTSAVDSIIELIKNHGYIVDHILETNSAFSSKFRSGTWLLRMQLANLQEHPPAVNSAGTLAAMTDNWRRRHGDGVQFATNLGSPIGASCQVGRMRVTGIDLPSHGTPRRRAYLIAGHVFGAHSLAMLAQSSKLFLEATSQMDQQSAHSTWDSMQQLLSYNEHYKLWFDLADSNHSYYNQQPYDEVRLARETNEYYGLANASDFLTRWQGQQQERHSPPRRRRKRGSRKVSLT